MKIKIALAATMLLEPGLPSAVDNTKRSQDSRKLSYVVTDTGQQRCYENGREMEYPKAGSAWFGQDAQYATNPQRYRDNKDGTVADLNTGLSWQKTPDFVKRDQDAAEVYAEKLELAGHRDWRLPSIKELFSIADFRGNMHTRTPYVDAKVFDFEYPNSNQGSGGQPGHRNMDGQYASLTRYLGTTMGRDRSAFGFNFADGRIKSYPLHARRYVRCVRGNPAYGRNRFRDNGDGTIADRATGLIWQRDDSGKGMDWRDALQYAENLKLAGKSDWRLPNVKELQSIVHYGRAPDATASSKRAPAIDPIFDVTTPESWYWSSTTHVENQFAYYVCFGQSFSARKRRGKQINAHGAGAVRSDPKQGDPADWPNGLGPQADEIRILNFVRCVRGGNVQTRQKGPAVRQDTGRPPEQQRGPRRGRRTERPRDDARERDQAKTLEVITVGTGSPLYNSERSSPCAMIHFKDSYLLVDMGEGTALKLLEEQIRLRSIAAFCFTHHHRDHNADATSILPLAWQRGSKAPIVGPSGTRKLTDFLLDFYREDLVYRTRNRGAPATPLPKPVVHELPLDRALSIDGIKITCAEVPHSIKTFAFRFDAGNKSIVISGDLSYSESFIELAKNADIAVMDSGGILYAAARTQRGPRGQGGRRSSGGRGKRGRPSRRDRSGRGPTSPRSGARGSGEAAHASMADVAKMAAKAKVRKLVLTHFRPGRVLEEETRREMSRHYPGEIVFARDMQVHR